METEHRDVTRLVVRLPSDLHAGLRAMAARHDRSLNGEIVTALRHYTEGLVEVRYVWEEPQEEAEQAWSHLAGATLCDDAEEGWDYTAEEERALQRMEQRRAAR